MAKKGERITYRFDQSILSSVHIVFNSDLNRETLPGSDCERLHSMRANQRLNGPIMHMPYTLCKSFVLTGKTDGIEKEIIKIDNNRKRCYHIRLNGDYSELTLIPLDSWGEDDTVEVISFDFE